MRIVAIGTAYGAQRVLREPLAWGGALVLVGASAGAGSLPMDPEGLLAVRGEMVGLGGLLGLSLWLTRSDGLRKLLTRAGPAEGQAASVGASASSYLVGALAPFICIACLHLPDLLFISGAGALALLHACCLATLLQSLPLPPSARSVALPLVAVALPAWLPREPRGAAVAAWLLDVLRPLRSPLEHAHLPSLEVLAPMMVCGIAAWVLGSGAHHRP